MDTTIAKRYCVGNSILLVPRNSALLFNLNVKNKEVRRENMLLLARRHGSIEKLSELTETDASYLRNIKNRVKGRGMGDKVAGRFEEKLKLGPAWMDTRHSEHELDLLGVDKLLEDIRVLPPLLRQHVSKIAAELRARVESIPEQFRDAIAAPPEHDPVSYHDWEASIEALAAQFVESGNATKSKKVVTPKNAGFVLVKNKIGGDDNDQSSRGGQRDSNKNH